MIEIITRQVLDANDFYDYIELLLYPRKKITSWCNISMLKRYINEEILVNRQAIAFVTIYFTCMLKCINIHIKYIVFVFFSDSLVTDGRNMDGIFKDNIDIQIWQDLKDWLVGLDGDEQLLMYLTEAGGTG